jgi:uncharacterized protein (TIGR02453 family)
MVHPSTLTFLTQLKKNNDKVWFDAHRKEYEEAKKDFESFVAQLLKALTQLEPAFGGQQAKDCIFRIFRDVRFSKDKAPYKSHFGAFFARGGRKWAGAGYYLHLEPGSMFAGGGLWMPEPAVLKKVRQEIDYDFERFKNIINNKAFKKFFPKLEGEQLSRPPQGYEPDNPAIEFLKMKSFTAGHALKDESITSKTAVKNVVEVFTALNPLINFLNRAVED